MYAQPVDRDLVRTLVEERLARSIQAYGVRGARAQRDCPLERFARWLVSRRRGSLGPVLANR